MLKEELDVDAELILGHGGVFKVAVDDRIVAERSSWRFPSEEEIVDAVAKALGR